MAALDHAPPHLGLFDMSRHYEATVEVPYVGSANLYICKFMAGFRGDLAWITQRIASITGQPISVVEPIVKTALLRKKSDAT